MLIATLCRTLFMVERQRSSKTPFILFLFVSLAGAAGQIPANRSPSAPSQRTLFVDCRENEQKHIFSPISYSEDQAWRAYVEVNVRGCLYTTGLWVSKANAPYKLIYLMPPRREAAANGMEILGWARGSSMLLVKTGQWPVGSDAPDTQQVLAIDTETGMVYGPNLEEMLQGRKNKQCMFRVTDAGFSAGGSVNILVRAQVSTFFEEGDTEEEVPLAKRCEKSEETWSLILLMEK
jgi:hypothetical protein